MFGWRGKKSGNEGTNANSYQDFLCKSVPVNLSKSEKKNGNCKSEDYWRQVEGRMVITLSQKLSPVLLRFLFFILRVMLFFHKFTIHRF